MFEQLTKWLREPKTKRKPLAKTRLQFDTLEDRITPTILPTGFSESVAASSLGSTTALAVAPDGKLFVAEQGGHLHVWQNNQQVQADFFANSPIHTQTFSERGLLGIAFDPNYAANHFVYVYFTTDPNNPDPTDPDPVKNDNHNVVARFTADGTGALAVAGTEKIIWDGDIHSAGNHNGGAIHFSPVDGKLYVAVGDDANQDLQAGTSINSQNLETYHGKILRLNSDGSRPSDNPFFTGNDPHRDAVFALGVRNPFTFAFQPGTGRLFIDDVGQNTWEEINDGVAGANYGWNITEGFIANPASPPPTLGPGTYHDPLLSYNHNNASPQTITGVAITGGVFYNPAPDAANPFPSSYNGKYFFSDLAGGFNHDHSVKLNSWIRTFDPAHPGTFANPDTSADFASNADSTVVGMALAPDGSIYYLARGNGGQVLQLSFTGTRAPSITQQPANLTETAGLSATFTVSASGTGPLAYQWQRNSGSGGSFVDLGGATGSSFTLTSVQVIDNQSQFRVIVSNSGGSVTSSAATLTVTANHPPAATITINSGLRGGNFDAGSPINFTLAATDQEDGTEPVSRFTYQVDYVTSLSSTPGGVVRPFIAATTGSVSASFTPSTTGPYTLTDVLYRITFTVTDAQGLTTVTTKDVNPNTSIITLQTTPTGLQLDVDGQSKTAPTSFRSVVGFQRLLDAPLTQSLGGTSYTFASWSDGGSSNHNVGTPATDATFTATYAAPNATIRIEAESLALQTYFVETNSAASGGKEISLKNGLPSPQNGTATGTFTGPTGLYLVTVGYYDESDGVSTLSLSLGGQKVDSWKLDRNLPSGNPDATSHTTREVGVVTLTTGESILLAGTSNAGEYARWDYLDFTPVHQVVTINAGGGAQGVYVADTDFVGGTNPSTTHAIDLSGVTDPAPAAVYQSWHNNQPVYSIPNLTPNGQYIVRLHFSENVATAPGQRVFNVAINGTTVLSNFDVFAAAGGEFKALVKQFDVSADASGVIRISFATVIGTTRVSGIEILSTGAAQQAAPKALTASGLNSVIQVLSPTNFTLWSHKLEAALDHFEQSPAFKQVVSEVTNFVHKLEGEPGFARLVARIDTALHSLPSDLTGVEKAIFNFIDTDPGLTGVGADKKAHGKTK